MDVIGLRRPMMIPVLLPHTPSGKMLVQLPSLEDKESQSMGSDFQPCKYVYCRKVSRVTLQVPPENVVRALSAIEPEPPETS